MLSSEIVPTNLKQQNSKDEVLDVEILPLHTPLKEKVTGSLVVVALLGLLGLSMVDQNARTAFIGLSVTLVGGYAGIEVIKSKQ